MEPKSSEDSLTSVADSKVIDIAGPRREFFRLLLKDIVHEGHGAAMYWVHNESDTA